MRLNREIKPTIHDAGNTPTDEPILSGGEHLTGFNVVFHAACASYPACNPGRLGALITKDGLGETGFGSIEELLIFIEKNFPEHKGHWTTFIVSKTATED